MIVVLGILAGAALPTYFNYSGKVKVAACKGTLGGVRSGIANVYSNKAINGTAAYPTYTDMNTLVTVMQEPLPENPYNSSNALRDADNTWANSTTTGVDEHKF